MPKAVVTVGDGGRMNSQKMMTHGTVPMVFSMHFMKPETVKVNDETELVVHLELEGKPFEKASVRYEIWHASDDEKHDWVDVIESNPGEYTALHSFEGEGTYTVQVHVEDDHDLHEHEEHEVVVVK